MEFKGTKGKWEYNGGDNSSIDIILPNNTTISVDRFNRYGSDLVGARLEMEANALLISKAPEMLDMLERMRSHWCETGLSETAIDNYMQEAKQLIKSATEL